MSKKPELTVKPITPVTHIGTQIQASAATTDSNGQWTVTAWQSTSYQYSVGTNAGRSTIFTTNPTSSSQAPTYIGSY